MSGEPSQRYLIEGRLAYSAHACLLPRYVAAHREVVSGAEGAALARAIQQHYSEPETHREQPWATVRMTAGMWLEVRVREMRAEEPRGEQRLGYQKLIRERMGEE